MVSSLVEVGCVIVDFCAESMAIGMRKPSAATLWSKSRTPDRRTVKRVSSRLGSSESTNRKCRNVATILRAILTFTEWVGINWGDSRHAKGSIARSGATRQGGKGKDTVDQETD